MSLTEILLLIIVIAGSAYAGYVFGRRSALSELGPEEGRRDAGPSESPLPGPAERLEPRRTGAPPPASAGGTRADASDFPSAGAPRRSPPPPASAGGSATSDDPHGQGGGPRRSTPPPPARAGLLDPGSGSTPPKKRG